MSAQILDGGGNPGGGVERVAPHSGDSFWYRVDRSGECWLWTGSITSAGYGNLRIDGGYDYAHRVAYRAHKGSIPAGLVIDHLCRNRACVRPDHLEAVPQRVNIQRGAAPYGGVRTECRHGHDITKPENVYTEPGGNHRCRVCAVGENAKRTAARRARGDLRKVLATHCRNGHPYDEVNTYVAPDGKRRCRPCNTALAAERRRSA